MTTALVTVTGTLLTADRQPDSGYVTFAPTVSAVDTDPTPAIITQRPIRATLDVDGKISVTLISSYDTGWAANGAVPYEVTIRTSHTMLTETVYIPLTGPVDLSELVDLDPIPEVSASVASALAVHAIDTTAVHGIADTAALVAHLTDTTDVHGIADTAVLVVTTDARLSDARTPTAHAATHASAGTDAVTLAESQVTGLTAALALKAPLASPAFTGNPTAPTPATGDADTSIATTAWVRTSGNLVRITRPNTDDRLVEMWNGTAWSVLAYDSGIRDVASLVITANWPTVQFARMRRVNERVYVWADGCIVATPVAARDFMYMPQGFRSSQNMETYAASRNQSTGAIVLWQMVNYGPNYALGIKDAITAGNRHSFSISAYTADAIPTSLPGTLYSAAPA